MAGGVELQEAPIFLLEGPSWGHDNSLRPLCSPMHCCTVCIPCATQFGTHACRNAISRSSPPFTNTHTAHQRHPPAPRALALPCPPPTHTQDTHLHKAVWLHGHLHPSKILPASMWPMQALPPLPHHPVDIRIRLEVHPNRMQQRWRLRIAAIAATAAAASCCCCC